MHDAPRHWQEDREDPDKRHAFLRLIFPVENPHIGEEIGPHLEWLGIADQSVEPRAANATMRKAYIAHWPMESVYIRASVVITPFPSGTNP